VAVCDVVPLVSVTVRVRFEVAEALLGTVIVTVAVPAPVIELGLMLAVTRLGSPDTLSDTGELKPPVTLSVIVTVPVALPDEGRRIVSEVGEVMSENPAGAAVTVSVAVVVEVRLPEVPVTVTG